MDKQTGADRLLDDLIRPKMPTAIRWMIRRDLADVLRIEQASYDRPWTEQEFLSCLRERNQVGMIVENQAGEIVAFFVYRLDGVSIRVLNMAVDPKHRRNGVGSQIVRKIIAKLGPHRRKRIVLYVRESNLGLQLFLRGQGFEAKKVVRQHYEDTGEDAYKFVFELIGSEKGKGAL